MKSNSKNKPGTDTSTNYSFLLKCMAAVAAAAVIGAGIAAATAATTTKALFATAVVVSTPWLLPAIIATVAIGSLLCLPFLISGSYFRSNRSSVTSYSVSDNRPHYSNSWVETSNTTVHPSRNSGSWWRWGDFFSSSTSHAHPSAPTHSHYNSGSSSASHSHAHHSAPTQAQHSHSTPSMTHGHFGSGGSTMFSASNSSHQPSSGGGSTMNSSSHHGHR